jgi:hypothetical protein
MKRSLKKSTEYHNYLSVWAEIAMQLATGWTVLESNPGGGEIFFIRQTGPGVHPASYTIGTGSLLGVKRPGRGIDHNPMQHWG